jgi:hypothetical protein
MLAAPLAARIQPTLGEALASSPAETPTKAPVIDCLVAVGVPNLAGSPMDLTDRWMTIQDPEVVLRHMEEAGIDYTIIHPAGSHEGANEEVAGLCRRYPGKFIGFANHRPSREKGRIRSMLFHEVRELGLRGVGELSEAPTREMLDAVRELGIPVLYHPGNDHGEYVELCQECVPQYPDVNFILCHLGSDTSDDWRKHLAGIELAKAYPNLYLETSAVIITPYLEKAIRELPAEKIIFGSDGESVDSRTEIYKIRVQKLPKEKEELILGGNMLRLLGGRV